MWKWSRTLVVENIARHQSLIAITPHLVVMDELPPAGSANDNVKQVLMNEAAQLELLRSPNDFVVRYVPFDMLVLYHIPEVVRPASKRM